jgi:hypothetical protein
MANGYGYTTQLLTIPYLTLDEYRNAPTAIDLDNLVYDSQDPEVQDAELRNAIARASSWADTYCNQVLGATTETEQQRSRVSTDGSIRFHPRFSPIVALTEFNYGYPTNMASLGDCSIAWIEDQEIIIPNAMLGTWTSQGPLSFGAYNGGPGNQMFLNYTYVAGYTNTLLSVPAIAGATTITVKDGTGITAGQILSLYDGMNTENVTVASTYTFGSTTVPLTRALVFSHIADVSVSALPPAIKQAVILITTAFLKVRGDSSMTMGVVSSANQSAMTGSNRYADELTLAATLLNSYARIR